MKPCPLIRICLLSMVLLSGMPLFVCPAGAIEPASAEHSRIAAQTELQDLLQRAEDLEYRDTKESRNLYENALKLAEEQGDLKSQAMALTGIGSAVSRMGDNPTAIKNYRKALKLADQLGDEELRSDIQISMGTSYFDLGDYEKALLAYQDSFRLRENTGDVERIAKSRTSIGNVYWMMEDYGKALEEFESALESFRSIGFELGVAGLSINVGKAYLELKRPDDAMAKFEEALSLFEKLDNPYGTGMAHACIGQVLMMKGDYAGALDRHLKALQIRKDAGDAKGEIDSMIAVAEACIPLKKFTEAHEQLRIALALATERETPNERKHVYRVYSQLYEAQGRQDKALSYYRKFVELRDELQRGEKEKNIQEIQIRYKVEQELERLQYEADMAELELRHTKSNRNMWIILAIITAILGTTAIILFLQKVKANRNLSRLARLDPLTGLSNRRDILERIEMEFARSRRSGNPFSILLLDADRFKDINDQYGHAVGDEVLLWLTNRIHHSLREADQAARWGGEEFLIVLPYTGMSGATRFAERLLEEITGQPFLLDGISIALTVTIGVAKLNLERDSGPENLISRADNAMYTGKEAGRNRVVVANWNGT